MKTRMLLAILVTFCLGFHGESPTARADEPSGPLKVVVHINVPEPGVQGGACATWPPCSARAANGAGFPRGVSGGSRGAAQPPLC